MTFASVKMVVNAIKVYARIKKEDRPNEKCSYTSKRNGHYEDIVFHCNSLTAEQGAGAAHKFRFHQIFDDNHRQNDIFDIVAKPVVISVLQGFNGTIFAYGQTGSGKTYTMTGSTKHYEDRGLIPRSLQHIFEAIEKVENKPTLYISYMEIYNEICYDLLSPRSNKTAIRLEELPRVTLLENKKGEPTLRNLSVLPVSTEEEAMRLLFLGDTNRAIAETPLNEYSSRSHCIFTVHVVSSRLDGSQTMTFSKLNLVDLAGSERVHKSNITGTVLNEAKHINLSLHFLQQVILALSESRRTHIPYRNSLMTLILKDSLAGNCLTVMLATLAVSKRNIQETISTCRFAQRVSLIKTDPVINEVSDPYQEILLLKNEVQELRKQLANREPGLPTRDPKCLTSKQKDDLEAKLEIYLNGNEDSFNLDLTTSTSLLQHCFRFFRDKIRMLESESLLSAPPKAKNSGKERKEETEQVWDETQNTREVDYYLKRLANAYDKAKLLSAAIEECQLNITYIKEKLQFMSNVGDCRKKLTLCKQLEHQQKIYRDSLMQLKDLKNETLQLEAGLTRAKAKIDHYSTGHLELQKETKQVLKQHLGSPKRHFQTENRDYCWKCLKDEGNSYGYSHGYEEHISQQSALRKQNEDSHECRCYPNYCKATDLPDLTSDYDARCRGHFKCGSLILPSIENKCGFIDLCSSGDFRTINDVCSCENCLFQNKTTGAAEASGASFEVQLIPDKLSKAQFPCRSWHCGPSPSCQEDFNILAERPPSCQEDLNMNLKEHSPLCQKDLNKSLKAPPPSCQEALNKFLKESPSLCQEDLNKVLKEPSPSCQEDLNRPLNEYGYKYDIFEEADTEEFRKFVSTLTLTGDEEVDREICDFYRAKLCI